MTSTAAALPKTYRKLVATKVSPRFREAVETVTVPMIRPGPGQLLVKSRYYGINASDINVTAARYYPGAKPPFDCGIEGVGEVVGLGADVKSFKVGQSVGYVMSGTFAEYLLVNETVARPLPAAKAEYLPLLLSGLTAAISIDKLGKLKPKEVVLVTATAGGTGQFAVQWAKHAGCHVIGVTSSQDKVKFLQSLGCDRVVNYTAEDLGGVLKAEYPKGVDVVYECIGGDLFETCLAALAPKGRLILIGFISGYESAGGASPVKIETSALLRSLLGRSVSLRGFLLTTYASDQHEYVAKLVELYEEGRIKCAVDGGAKGGTFRGLEGVADAVEYMFSRKNIGKVFVES